MNRNLLLSFCFTGAFALLAACGKPDPANELEKAAAALNTSDAAAPAPTAETDPAAPSAPPPSAQVREALADYKAGKMEDAVTRLQLLRNTPVLTAQQRMALQDSIAAVMGEVYALAEKGDPRAIAAVAQYERMQTRH